ncbi:hypothetical protein ACIOWK_32750 [Pseudomonas protegens]|uniref:hypothetical protein n=1 Tax=Pseudomonas protegens TaxID=380021 RepID=UPI003803EC69
MDHKEIPTSIPPADERITIVLKAQEGSTLNQIRQFVSLGMPVAIGRGMAVIAGASDEDLQMVLGQEREERQMQAELWEAAIGAPAHLAAHAQEMHALLHRINVKVGGLNAVLGHGGEPSELMWDEHNEALDAIWELLAKIRSAASVDTAQVNQIAQKLENVNQTTGIPVVSEARESLAFGAAPSVITENPAITDLMHIDDRIRMAANARRYEWLRNVAFDTPRQDLVPRDRLGNMLIEQDLDGEIDRAMKAYPGEQEDEPCVD